MLNLSPAGDLVEAAANLFAMLRALDRPEYKAIAVMPIPEDGLGVAINDRLKRARRSPAEITVRSEAAMAMGLSGRLPVCSKSAGPSGSNIPTASRGSFRAF